MSSDNIKDKIREKLKAVVDPEIGLDIVEAGFVRDIQVDNEGIATISLMLTSPFCPLSFYIVESIRTAAMSVPGIKDVKVNIVGFGIPPELKKKLEIQEE